MRKLVPVTVSSRKGAAHVLIAAMLFTFLVTAAMTIDYAYMQLIRTELRTATDAAAKAGAEALARTQDTEKAKEAAVHYASLNKVGGQPFKISKDDVSLGRVTAQQNGSWSFTAGATPYNSVRINSKVGNGASTAAIPTFIAPALGHGAFTTSLQATAGQQEVEICLCIDRSGSMMFDMSGTEWAYPGNNTKRYPSGYYPDSFWRNYCSPPHPSQSRWAAMSKAVDIFLKEAGKFKSPPRTALVTWGTNMTLPYYPNTVFSEVATDVILPAPADFQWCDNELALKDKLSKKSDLPVGGGTNLSSGLDRAVQVLTGSNSRSLSNKIIILLTDGQWNTGRDPVDAAKDAAKAGVVVHTISMLTAAQPTLTEVAQLTGGKYYVTTNATQLEEAFRELAKSLPIILTD